MARWQGVACGNPTESRTLDKARNKKKAKTKINPHGPRETRAMSQLGLSMFVTSLSKVTSSITQSQIPLLPTPWQPNGTLCFLVVSLPFS